MGFELPKQLAMSSIAVRILHTHYDHLSLLARMAHQKMHTPSHRSDRTLFANDTFTTIALLLRTILCSGSRSLAGGDEIAADIDVPEQGEKKEDEDVKEDDEVQQQGVDEEVHSIQGSEGQKVRSKTELLVFDSLQCDIFIPLVCVSHIERSQSTVEEKQPPACRRPIKPDTDTDGST